MTAIWSEQRHVDVALLHDDGRLLAVAKPAGGEARGTPPEKATACVACHGSAGPATNIASLLTREPSAEARFDDEKLRTYLGVGAE